MAKIEKGMVTIDGFKFRNKVTVDLLLTDQELEQLESYRVNMEEILKLPKGMVFTLDDAVLDIVGTIMRDRVK